MERGDEEVKKRKKTFNVETKGRKARGRGTWRLSNTIFIVNVMYFCHSL